jgi:hypothetical protein
VPDPPPEADDPDEDAQRLASWTDHVDDYVGCLAVLIDQFRGVAAYDHVGKYWSWRGRGGKDGEALVPSHLTHWVAPPKAAENGTYVEGALRCPCGRDRLELRYPGATHPDPDTGSPIPRTVELPGVKGDARYWFGIQAVCPACRRKCLVFDSKRHGWESHGA